MRCKPPVRVGGGDGETYRKVTRPVPTRPAAHHPPTPRRPPLAQGGRHLGAVACPARWGQPALLSLADARLAAVVSPPPRAHPPLSPLEDASRLDAELLGRPNGAGRHRHLWHRAHS